MAKAIWSISATILLLAGCAGTAGTSAEKLTMRTLADATAVTIHAGGRTLLEYRYQQVPFKPYVKHLYSPSGVDVVRDMVPDHKHHHGLMFAVNAGGVDFWAENPKCGNQNHRPDIQTHSDSRDGTMRTGFVESLEWVGPGESKSIMREIRQIECYQVAEANATLLSWRSTLRAGEGPNEVILAGSHYFGLGMRFPVSMDDKGEFFSTKGKVDGEVVRGSEQLTPGDWCAVYGTIDGKPVTVAMFDHPGNVRKALWFTMSKPFSYLSATLNYFRQPLKLKKDQSLSLSYGVAVWDGRVDPQIIEKTSKQWLKLAGEFEKTK